MIYDSYKIKINDIELSDPIGQGGFGVVNTTPGGFHKENLSGAASIIEDAVPHGESPYFYGVERKPLEFSLTLALLDWTEERVVSELVRILMRPVYQTYSFGVDEFAKKFDCIVIGAPQFEYITREGEFEMERIGTITIKLRCSSSTGYLENPMEVEEIEANTPMTIGVENYGDETVYANLHILLESNDDDNHPVNAAGIKTGLFTIRKDLKSKVVFNVLENEEIHMDMGTKTIKSTEQRDYPIYPRWNSKSYLEVEPGYNEFEVICDFKTTLALSFRSIKYV